MAIRRGLFSRRQYADPWSPLRHQEAQAWLVRALSRAFLLAARTELRQIYFARAHGLWTYEPRQGRKAATVVCSASAVVTLAFTHGLSGHRTKISAATFQRRGRAGARHPN